MPVELDYTQPVTTIPSGYRTVNFRQLNYNTIPSPVRDGQEIIINIPPIPNAWIDPSTSYLSMKVTLRGKYVENGTLFKASTNIDHTDDGPSERIDADKLDLASYGSCIDITQGHLINFNDTESKGIFFNYLKSVGYFNSNGWALFRRYQLYANNSKLIEDIDEIGKLASIMNPLTRSQSTYTSSHAHLDDVTGVFPGHRFAILRSIFVEGGDIDGAGRLKFLSNAFGINPLENLEQAFDDTRIDSILDSDYHLESGGDGYPDIYANEYYKYLRMTNALLFDVSGAMKQPNLIIYDSLGNVTLPRLDQNSDLKRDRLLHGDSLLEAAPLSLSNLCRDSSGFHIWANQICRHDHPGQTDVSERKTIFNGLIGKKAGADVLGRNYIGAVVPTDWSHTVDITLPLIGILGANNEKLYPCTYPTQIRLITEAISKVVSLPPTMYDVTLHIPTVEFCCNYLRLDSGAMSQVLDSLPIPGVIPMRCTSFVHSSVLLPKDVAGQVQQLVSSRRASMKALFISFEKHDPNCAEGVFNSINPNLGSNTYLQVNGVFYPQMMLDPLNKPGDCYNQLLTTLNMTQSALLRPSIHYNNYLRSDAHIQQYNYWAKRQNLFGQISEGALDFLAFDHGTNYIFKVPQYCRALLAENVTKGQFGYYCGRNQFYLAIDTEHFGRRGFLSGISTLGGSCFMNLNIQEPLLSAYTVHYFNFHDLLLAFNLNTGDVEVKI